MSEIIIRTYEPKDHDEIVPMFGDGCKEHINTGLKIGIWAPHVIGYILMSFLIGSLHSKFAGIICCLIAIMVYATSVFMCHYMYQW